MDARRSRTPLVLGIVGAVACLALVLLLIISVTVGILVYRGGEEGASRPAGPVESSPVESGPVSTGSATEGPSAEADPSSDAPEEGGIRADELVLPPGVAPDQPYLELSTSEDGPVVDVFRDFLCPPCKDFQRIQGDDLIQLALDNEITLRVHPRPMLDATSDPPGYSSRAAHAAVCAYAQNPEKWFPAEITLFENQPGNEGLPDHERPGPRGRRRSAGGRAGHQRVPGRGCLSRLAPGRRRTRGAEERLRHTLGADRRGAVHRGPEPERHREGGDRSRLSLFPIRGPVSPPG